MMTEDNVTYANGLGELLAPILKLVRATGFFEAYIFMPSMTLLSIYLFVRLMKRLQLNDTFQSETYSRFKPVLLFAYYSICFMATNVLAVAFKTLIIEEMDYEEPVWFLHLVGPLHFYIESVVLAYLWILLRNDNKWSDKVLGMYVQFGLFGGYSVAIYRLLYEPFELLDVTTGFSGIFLITWLGILNIDIVMRFLGKNLNQVTLKVD